MLKKTSSPVNSTTWKYRAIDPTNIPHSVATEIIPVDAATEVVPATEAAFVPDLKESEKKPLRIFDSPAKSISAKPFRSGFPLWFVTLEGSRITTLSFVLVIDWVIEIFMSM